MKATQQVVSANSPGRIPIIICIDAEPDAIVPNPRKPVPWLGFEKCVELFAELRDQIATTLAGSVHFSWFVRLDKQVEKIYGAAEWPAEYYRSDIDAFLRAGDEIALHAHPSRWSGLKRIWVEDFADQAWIDECVETSIETFRQAFGQRCGSFRFGNHWMNQPTFDLLDSLGMQFELSLEPGTKAMAQPKGNYASTRGCLPDYEGLPRVPYRPSRNSFRDPDPGRSDGPWVVPVSMARVDAHPHQSTGPWHKATRMGLEEAEFDRLGLWYEPDRFQLIMDRCLSDLTHPCLVATLRSNLPLNPKMHDNIVQNISYITGHPLASQFMFATPAEAVAALVG